MSNAAIYSRAQLGLDAPLVTVETHLTSGLPGFTLVGLPAAGVREARDRVRSAIMNSGFRFPRGKVIVNLAPGDLAKEGPRYDLAIAASVLCATGQLPVGRAAGFEFLGELSLDGSLRAIRGGYCAALAVGQAGSTRTLVLPAEHFDPAVPLSRSPLLLAHLRDLPRALQHPQPAALVANRLGPGPPARPPAVYPRIQGQPLARRALALAAAGGHHILFAGPPGAGKTMLARALADLLPPLDADAQQQVARVYSAAGMAIPAAVPPFREPHHSTTASAMIGGGRDARPGELTLASHGVLFLDELPHFPRNVLELLREPMSRGAVSLSRAAYRVVFPAAFQLVAAMNPCPSGNHCQSGHCRCEPLRVRRYQGRISGPLLDRIDLHLAIAPLAHEALMQLATGEGQNHQAEVESLERQRAAISGARARQKKRRGTLNGAVTDPATGAAGPGLPVSAAAKALLEQVLRQSAQTARSASRLLRLAETAADLAGCDCIDAEHLAEAFSYRQLDWEGGLGMRAY